MKRVPPLEANNRAIEQKIKDLQKRLDGMDNRVVNIEKMVKKLDDQSCSILKIVANKINTLLDKMKQGRIHGLNDLKEEHGPDKQTRDNSKKTELLEAKDMDDLKASVVNMNILTDQATDVLKTLQLSFCWLFTFFLFSFPIVCIKTYGLSQFYFLVLMHNTYGLLFSCCYLLCIRFWVL